jgi:GTPase
MNDKTFESGFVSIIGRPNVGKSALLNRLVGQKLAITTNKPQTTRNRILGVKNLEDCQIVFLDTPGIHKKETKFNQYMTKIALISYHEVDVILLVIDNEKEEEIDTFILDKLKKIDTPLFLVINKIDLLKKEDVSAIEKVYRDCHSFKRILPVSALTGENIDALLKEIKKELPPGPMYFPDDMLTDRSESFMMAELIREKIIIHTKQEIPYSIAVVVDELEIEDALIRVKAVIYVEKDSQKGIIIGKGGKMLKRIGQEARKSIEDLFGSKLYLGLWVKVRKDWRKDDKSLKEFGYY